MKYSINSIPIIIGKLKKEESSYSALIGGINQVKYVDEKEYPILDKMKGFLTFSQIARECECEEEYIRKVFQKYRGDSFLRFLKDWNKLRWCEVCRVYINAFVSSCPHCSSELFTVPLSPPCDPVFCFGGDYLFIKEKIEKHLGYNLKGDPFLLLNTGLYKNRFFWEVVAEGRAILKIEFRGWKEEDWEYIFTDDFDTVQWNRAFPPLFEERNRQLDAGRGFLRILENDTLALIKNSFPLLNPDQRNLPLIYFSGGKESMVMHEILKKGGIKCQLLFASTGLDFPDDEAFIEELAEDKEYLAGNSLHLEFADKEKALSTLNSKGMMSVDDMWCRWLLKYPTRNKAVEAIYEERGYVAFEGSRKYENDFRRSHPVINFITDIKGYKDSKQIWLHPLAYWNGFDVWSYIFSHDLKINPLYFKGFHRTTCWMCPLVNPFHLKQSLKYCKDLWQRVDKFDLNKTYESFSQWNNPF